VTLYGEIINLIKDAPRIDRQRALKIAESVAARGAESRQDAVFQMLDVALARISLTGAGRPPAAEIVDGEAQVLQRLAPGLASAQEWAALSRDLSERISHGRGVNVDAASLLMDAVFKINALPRPA